MILDRKNPTCVSAMRRRFSPKARVAAIRTSASRSCSGNTRCARRARASSSLARCPGTGGARPHAPNSRASSCTLSPSSAARSSTVVSRSPAGAGKTTPMGSSDRCPAAAARRMSS